MMGVGGVRRGGAIIVRGYCSSGLIPACATENFNTVNLLLIFVCMD